MAYQIAWDPELLPPPELMKLEGVEVLEEWFRWAEEWSAMLRVYGGITADSAVLEIGCGLGRVAMPLRHVLLGEGTYDGFDINRSKIAFLKNTFQQAYPSFRFTWLDVHNTYYNPTGWVKPTEYHFPYKASTFDLVFAASVFTHMLPENTAYYLAEAGRVLRPTGRCVFSFFLLDNYRRGQKRPQGFSDPHFAFDHPYKGYGGEFAVSFPDDPERMTAYRVALIERFAAEAGLRLSCEPVPGMWSGTCAAWIATQDLLVLEKIP